MKIRMFLAAAAALLLAACNPGAQMEEAKGQIDKFHALYNAGDAKGFYRAGGQTLSKVAKPEQVEATITLISARLGKIRSSEQVGFNTAFNNGASSVTITMRTRFECGEGTETFVFNGSGENMELFAWNVNSPLLELSPEDVKKLTEETGKAAR